MKYEGSSSGTDESNENIERGADPRGAALFLASGLLSAAIANLVILLLAAAGAAAPGSRSANARIHRQSHKRSNRSASSSVTDRSDTAVAGLTVARVGAATVSMLAAVVVFLGVVALERPGTNAIGSVARASTHTFFPHFTSNCILFVPQRSIG